MEKILEKLVSFKTLSEKQSVNKSAIKWIRGQMKDLPFYYKSFSSNKFPSFIATTKKTTKPKLWLYSHLDVVPGKDSLFKLKKKNGKYYGRGVYDMKFALACYLKLFSELGNDLSKMDLGLMVTSDEEVGGYNGAGHIISKGYGGNVCFLPDGGEDWNFEKASKGLCYVLAESDGCSCHGSQPWNGENALEEMMDFLCSLRKHFPKEPCGSTDHFHNTINIGMIESGETVNQVPDHAKALIDIRMTPGTDKSVIENILKKERQRFKEINTTTLVFSDAHTSDLNHEYFKLFKKIANEKGIQTGSMQAHGSSDARFFGDQNIPTISIRPKGGGQHADDEWISVRDLDRFYKVLKEFVLSVS